MALRQTFFAPMHPFASPVSRRRFLTTSSAAAMGLALGQPAQAKEFKTKLYGAKIVGKADEATLRPLKEAGFDGVEVSGIIPEDQANRDREVVEKLGMRVHSVLRGWAEFNSDDPKKLEDSYALTEAALRTAHGFGSDTILLVPCRVALVKMPDPWDFDVEFDPATNHLTRVVKGDNAPYQAYINAHNKAIDGSREQVKRLIPLAEKLGVVIGLENVWNNLWVRPDHYQNFVASFDNPWVKSYLDVGNHVKYLVPMEEWVRKLGPLVAKIHIKDYALAPDQHSGKFVHLRDGSMNWPAVRQALDDIGYNGWLTIEDGGLTLPEFRQRLNTIIAGA